MNDPLRPRPPLPCTRRRLAALLLAGLGAAGCAQAAAADWGLVQDGTVVLLRHASAPGVGDPPGFTLDDCSTQRNLDDAGRAQAKRLGQAFRGRQVAVRQVLPSQWCRTRETAQLAFPGLVQDAPVFNSFFADAGRDRDREQTAQALALLGQWRGPGVLVVVTHQVNITALSGVVPASGEAVVLRPAAGRLQLLGRLQP